MKIRISREELLRQVDEQSPSRSFLGHTFLLEGEDVSETHDEFDVRFPTARTHFTAREYRILKLLFAAKAPVRRSVVGSLGSGRNEGDLKSVQNVANVHIKNIRRKIILHDYDFKLLNGRRGMSTIEMV